MLSGKEFIEAIYKNCASRRFFYTVLTF